MQQILGLLRLLVLIVIVLFGLVLHLRNSDSVTLDLYFFKLTQPLSLLLAMTVALGGILGILAALPKHLGHRRTIRQLRRELKAQSTLSSSAMAPTQLADTKEQT
jgi:putative membrane protein